GSNFVNCPVGSPTCNETATNLNLQPEKSFGWDVGADVRYHGNTTISLDFYRNNLFGQMFQFTEPQGQYQPPQGGSPRPLLVLQYRNLNESIMKGINLDVDHSVPHGVFW